MKAVYKTIAQAAAIVVFATALSLGVNALRPDGLPLLGASPSAVKIDQSSGEISIKDAAMLFASGRAVFLDARPQFAFEQGHIQGAINLPPREFASQFQDIKPRLAGKEAIITYCDGERCPLGEQLAMHLRDTGLKNVLVLKNGWTLWTAEGLPVEQRQ